MDRHEKMIHVGITPEQAGKYVFVPGSVERAALIAKYFDEPRMVCHQREFLTYTGKLEGIPVSVTSTGIGGPSAAITVEEYVKAGAHTFLRVGSCASTSPKCGIGDVIIPNGAVRMEGTGDHFLPLEFPAVPDLDMVIALEEAAVRLGYKYNIGVSITKDSFYTEVTPHTKPVYYELKNKWEAYEKGGATSTCMECAPLFLMGSSLKVRTAAVLICATNYNVYSNDDKDYPRDWEDRAIKTGIEAMKIIIRQDKLAGKC